MINMSIGYVQTTNPNGDNVPQARMYNIRLK